MPTFPIDSERYKSVGKFITVQKIAQLIKLFTYVPSWYFVFLTAYIASTAESAFH